MTCMQYRVGVPHGRGVRGPSLSQLQVAPSYLQSGSELLRWCFWQKTCLEKFLWPGTQPYRQLA